LNTSVVLGKRLFEKTVFMISKLFFLSGDNLSFAEAFSNRVRHHDRKEKSCVRVVRWIGWLFLSCCWLL